MKFAFLFAITLASLGCSPTITSIVELPRPNSGAFTFAEAEARKSEIRALVLTPPDREWIGGTIVAFAVHIDRADGVFVYNHETDASSTDRRITIAELKELLIDYKKHLMGQPATVLITAEISPVQSKRFSEIIDLLFKPSIQIVYKKKA